MSYKSLKRAREGGFKRTEGRDPDLRHLGIEAPAPPPISHRCHGAQDSWKRQSGAFSLCHRLTKATCNWGLGVLPRKTGAAPRTDGAKLDRHTLQLCTQVPPVLVPHPTEGSTLLSLNLLMSLAISLAERMVKMCSRFDGKGNNMQLQ